eukprot:4163201-Pyramimonas_sp.AAC.1
MGNVAAVRGQPWAIMSEGDKPPYKLVSCGALTRAIYNAFDREPQNKNVIETLNAGLEGVALYSHKAPVDVLRWLRDFHDEFRGGSGFTLLELYEPVEKIEGMWKAEAILKGYDVSNQVSRHQYIDKHWPGKVSTAHVFNVAKATMHALGRANCKKPVLALLGSTCNFADPAMKNEQ